MAVTFYYASGSPYALPGANPGLEAANLIGPKMTAWTRRMEALPCTQKTWPPHWK